MPTTKAAIIPPTIANSVLIATNPEIPSIVCADITLNPNQPIANNQAPKARNGIFDGGNATNLPFRKRPVLLPSKRIAAKAIHPPTACTTIDPAKS